MKILKGIILIVILLGCVDVTLGQTKSDSLLEASLDKSKAVGVVAGYISDSKKWSSSIGYKDLDRSEKLTIDTKIRIASITKIMTAVATMQLIEKGVVVIDSPISDYFDGFSNEHQDITIKQLLTHSSGIRAYKSSKERENYHEYMNLEDAYGIVKDDGLEMKSGSDFSYTSYGYGLLGIVIEQVSGLSYEAYLTQNIWETLGMRNTGVEQLNQIDQTFSQLYHRSSNGKVKKAKRRTDLSDRIPAGGVYSTVNDVLLFGKGLLNGELISDQSFKEMITDSGLKKQGNPYGYGLYLYGENPKCGNVVGHSGTQKGASAQLMLLPDKKAAVFVASNTSGIWEEMFYLNVKLFAEVCE